jgi:hypothetical protein
MFKIANYGQNTYKTKTKTILTVIKKNFQLLTPEEYLVNMKESQKRMNVESCVLRPLPEASKNHG